jgi:hypothetical protein
MNTDPNEYWPKFMREAVLHAYMLERYNWTNCVIEYEVCPYCGKAERYKTYPVPAQIELRWIIRGWNICGRCTAMKEQHKDIFEWVFDILDWKARKSEG